MVEGRGKPQEPWQLQFFNKKKENRTHEGGRVGAGCCSSSRSCSTPSSWSWAAPGTVLHTWVFHLFEVVHTLSCSPSWEWCLPGCSIQVRCSPELFVPCWRRALTKTRGMRRCENGYCCTWWMKLRSFLRNEKHINAPGEKDYNVSFIGEQKLSPYTLFTLVSKSQSE